MLLSALRVSLAIIFLRAGPQDMPYDPGPRLMQQVVLVSIASLVLCGWVSGPLSVALVLAPIMVLVQALATRITVSARRMDNRFQQTFAAILLTNSLLMLVLLPALASLAPVMDSWAKALQAHPDWIQTPEKLAPVPAGPALMVFAVGLWQFIVSVRILGRAIEVSLPVATLVAMLFALGVFMLFELIVHALSAIAG